ncbi:MAG: phosphoribosylamine--glycine ligase [Deltaproteobacteria bacterium]|nr:MAG: phosphoribosylamine--glycine ligase [Deltaproteobacteria bacterium]
MRVLVLGSGGREHALAWAIGRSPRVEEVLCAPGSDGIRADARVLPVDPGDADAVVALARRESVELVVVGPEAPLVQGVADRLEAAGVPVFGPSAEAARLEGSKAFAKSFMNRHRIPTAAHRVFDAPEAAERYVEERNGPLVVKADGLAGGKGVSVCRDVDEAKRAIHEAMREQRFGQAGKQVVIEERLEGEEASYYAISDGRHFVCLAAAQDHKRALDGDEGENTGGMGAYSPTPVVDAALERKIVERIVRPTLTGMRSEGRPYRGVLYVGLMIVDGDPYVIEFNVRFGDPETQPLLFRLESDLVPLLEAAAHASLGSEGEAQLRFGDPAVCVVLTSAGYPRGFATGFAIEGLEAHASAPDVKIFHAGTRFESGSWRTAGGRVLGVTARGSTLAAARQRAYEVTRSIRFKGVHVRTDIARRAQGSDA